MALEYEHIYTVKAIIEGDVTFSGMNDLVPILIKSKDTDLKTSILEDQKVYQRLNLLRDKELRQLVNDDSVKEHAAEILQNAFRFGQGLLATFLLKDSLVRDIFPKKWLWGLLLDYPSVLFHNDYILIRDGIISWAKARLDAGADPESLFDDCPDLASSLYWRLVNMKDIASLRTYLTETSFAQSLKFNDLLNGISFHFDDLNKIIVRNETFLRKLQEKIKEKDIDNPHVIMIFRREILDAIGNDVQFEYLRNFLSFHE
jgi:hypothetical protein